MNAKRDCDIDKFNKTLGASVDIDFRAIRAQAGPAATYTVPYFVAVSTEGHVLAKQLFSVQFSFAPDQRVVDQGAERVVQLPHIPRPGVLLHKLQGGAGKPPGAEAGLQAGEVVVDTLQEAASDEREKRALQATKEELLLAMDGIKGKSRGT